MTTAQLAKSYTPSEAEPLARAKWDEHRAFHADPNAKGEPYCILIPPPNVTAALHLGHAFNNTLQDILTRHHRMRGFKTLWMPGTDHAGIATQTVVEKRLMLQGKRRTDFSRDEFIAKVQEWKDEYEATIIDQLKLMGCSCDFGRTRFTMDEVCATAVREAFFRLFKDGLIYRGKRLVNWDPVTQTALADDEVEMEEVQGHMHYLRYPLTDGKTFITVATTRPETMLGDTAVAINPRDPRAAQFVGKKIRLPLVGREIPIIADDYVVRSVEFGGDENDAKAKIATGFLKVTPAHDDNDYQIGLRHNLPLVNVFAPDATISDKHGWTDVSDEARPLLGLSREKAREAVVKWFKDRGLLEAVKPYTHSVGHSYRSHVPIEPYLSDQWYVKVTDDRMRGEALRAMSPAQREHIAPALAGVSALHTKTSESPKHTPAKAGAKYGDGELEFFPARYAKTFETWHENIRDWCISRQIWWGHRIPVWSTFGFHCESGEVKQLLHNLKRWTEENRVAVIVQEAKNIADAESPHWALPIPSLNIDPRPSFEEQLRNPNLRGLHVCVKNEHDVEILEELRRWSFEQDPDVLDTWFSSGLWPISTMGWPAPGKFPAEFPEGEALLEAFNPSSVLLTAREIITLWVSRMVMFNRHFRDGKLPFRHVYVHAMIQDGHGQKMSKSLGNGVDPRDIIHTHGADAMRFVLCQMATGTQDARMPVDMICPHPGCGEAFEPRQITSPAGYRVADAILACPKCGKKMVSGYGAASGLATPSDAMPLARNTSTKFDLGRNFANKLWNATRFALSNLSEEKAVPSPWHGFGSGQFTLADRWILSRLHRTLIRIEEALKDYQFNAYAEAMYDFIWRDFCDWYLEAVKPTIRTSPDQQAVLRAVLSAAMRMLHPIMPFVTETLWPHVAAGESPVLAAAAWPDRSQCPDDAAAVAKFERLQNLINAIRNLRSERNLPPKKRIILHAPAAALHLIQSGGGVVESLAGLEAVHELAGNRPSGAVPLTVEGSELLLSGLVDAVDASAERSRLGKLIEEKDKAASNLRAKLSNPGYVNKAPAKVVEETRAKLAEAEAELAAARSAIESLAG